MTTLTALILGFLIGDTVGTIIKPPTPPIVWTTVTETPVPPQVPASAPKTP